MGSKKTKTAYFVVDGKTSYKALLGRDWIHGNKCVPSSMHQKLVMWKESGEVKTIEADPQPFQVNSNFVEAQLYNEDVKPVSYKDDPE